MEIVDSIGVRLLPEMRGFKAAVEKEIKKLDTKVTVDVELGKVDTKQARVDIAEFQAAMRAKEINLRAQLDLDTSSADRALDRVKAITRDAAKSTDRLGDSNGHLDLSFLRLGGSIGATTLKFGALAGSLAPVLTFLSSVQLAIAQMIPIMALLPAGAVVAAGAMQTLKLGLTGFSEALKNMDDPEKFAESLKKLSPAAREAAVAVQGLRAPFKEMQQLVQERLFAGLAGDIKETGSVLLTALRPGLVGVAAEFNHLGRDVLEFGRSADTVSFVNDALQGTKGVMGNVREALVPLMEGFREIARVGVSMLPELTKNFGGLAETFKNWATRISESGQLKEMIESAIAALKDMGAVIGNVFGIIRTVLDAATGSGEGLFATMRQVTDTILNLLTSADGKQALTTFFQALKTIADALMPIFTEIGFALFNTIVPAFEALAPAIASGLSALAPAITPLAEALAAMGPVIGALAQQFSQLLVKAIQALEPVIVALAPVVTDMINLLGQTLGGVLVALTPLLLTLAQILSQVLAAGLEAITPLIPIIVSALSEMATVLSGTLAAALPTLVEVARTLGGAMVQAITTLVPMLPQIVAAWAQLFTTLVPLLPMLAKLAAEVLPSVIAILPTLLPLLISLAQMWVEIAASLLPVISTIVQFLIPALQSILNVVNSVVGNVVPLVQGMFDFFSGTIGFFVKLIRGDFAGAWESAKQAVAGAFHVIEGIVKTVGSILLAPIRIAIDTVTGVFRNAGGDFGNAIRSAINAIPQFLGNLGGMLVEAGKSLIRGFIEGIGSMVGAAVNKVSGLVQSVRDFFPFSPAKEGPFSGRGYTLYSGRALAEDFATGIRERSFLAAQATAGLMDAATLDPGSLSGSLGSLDGAVERTYSFKAGSIANEVAEAVKSGLASAEFTIDQNGIFRVNQKADINYNRR